MGRMIKNTVFKNGSYAIGIPQGSSTVIPAYPNLGQVRFNVENNKLEFYSNVSGVNTFQVIAREGSANILRDSFTGNGSQTDFTFTSGITYDGTKLSTEVNKVVVFVGTVIQQPTTNYTFPSSTSIHFTSPPLNGATISVIHNLGSTVAS